MPDPLIIVASSAATWVVKKLLDQLALPAIKALLRSKGLDDKEVWRLEDALQNAKLVLGAVPVGVRAAGIKIENVNLGEPILQVQQLAAELAKYLDELEYYDIREKVTSCIGVYITDFRFAFAIFIPHVFSSSKTFDLRTVLIRSHQDSCFLED